MSSVVVSWKGRCVEREAQKELLFFAHLLAQHHQARWAELPAPRPKVLEVLNKQRSEGLPQLPDIRKLDRDLSGRIVVCSDVMENESVFAAEAARLGLPCERLERNSTSLRSALTLNRLRVRGVDFRLFDPRGLYPGEDRMSFVFLASEAPFLDGLLGLVHDRKRCETSPNPLVGAADWYIECPFVHLRDYLMAWFADLLAWMKFFFIPDLRYYPAEDLGEYEKLRRALEQLQSKIGVSETRSQSFDQLVNAFSREADRWTQDISKLV